MTPANFDPDAAPAAPSAERAPPLAVATSRAFDLGLRKTDFVLLVDDPPMVGEAIRRIVAQMDGFDYHCVSDPLAAPTAIADIQPTVVLLDLMMPGLDGLSLLAQIRSDPATEYLPVVMLSTTDASETRAQAFAAGTDDYLVKIPDSVELPMPRRSSPRRCCARSVSCASRMRTRCRRSCRSASGS